MKLSSKSSDFKSAAAGPNRPHHVLLADVRFLLDQFDSRDLSCRGTFLQIPSTTSGDQLSPQSGLENKGYNCLILSAGPAAIPSTVESG